jgi:hypothetical protein
MVDKARISGAISKLVDQLEAYTASAETRGRLRVDLGDLAEASWWYLSKMEQIGDNTLDEMELEDLLIEIDVKFIEHVTFHIESLRKDLAEVLKNFPNDEEGDGEPR